MIIFQSLKEYFVYIMKKRKIMNKIIEYRNKHPRCRYCKYSYLLNAPKYLNIWIHKCDLKDEVIKFFDWKYCGCFCKYFELENLND